ncbi:MAG: hypothetical protein O9972_19225, partial [Burkholderiales bacterium]|nr:hypothetical protein [Burkholderiales bacterium]
MRCPARKTAGIIVGASRAPQGARGRGGVFAGAGAAQRARPRAPRGSDARVGLQRGGLVGPLPAELRLLAAEVAV